MNRSSFNLLISLTIVMCAPASFAAGEHCNTTYLVNTHNAKITDPVGEQTAQFDLSRGAILVSLQYQGVEYIAAPTTNAGAQVILRTTTSGGSYTPTMGGNAAGQGSVTTGVACSANHLWLMSGMTDAANNAGTSTAVMFKDSQWYFDQYIGTYVVSTYAYFVPNPAGAPRYYLEIDRTINNIDASTDIDAQEAFAFTLDLVTAVPTQFSSLAYSPSCTTSTPCANTSAAIAAGMYTAGYGSGLATAVFPSTDWSGQPGSTSVTTESLADRRVLHVNRTMFTVAAQSSATYSQYLMVGSWLNASAFANDVCWYTVSEPTDGASSTGSSGSISITTNSACRWEVASDVPWITVSPGSGVGTASVTYTVSANTSGVARTGNLHVAGRVFPMFQNP